MSYGALDACYSGRENAHNDEKEYAKFSIPFIKVTQEEVKCSLQRHQEIHRCIGENWVPLESLFELIKPEKDKALIGHEPAPALPLPQSEIDHLAEMEESLRNQRSWFFKQNEELLKLLDSLHQQEYNDSRSSGRRNFGQDF